MRDRLGHSHFGTIIDIFTQIDDTIEQNLDNFKKRGMWRVTRRNSHVISESGTVPVRLIVAAIAVEVTDCLEQNGSGPDWTFQKIWTGQKKACCRP